RHLAKIKRRNVGALVPVGIILLLVAVFYLIKLFSYDYIQSTPDPSKYSAFYMSPVMVLLTIAIPYLIGWTLVIKVALNIAEYRRRVPGVIYKGALFRVSIGIMLVAAFYIVVQLLIAFSTF